MARADKIERLAVQLLIYRRANGKGTRFYSLPASHGTANYLAMQTKLRKRSATQAFTLVEILLCFAVMALVIGGMLTAYAHAGLSAERAGYELAAEAQAVQTIERVRAAKWDTQSSPAVDYTTNVPTTTINVLEIPVAGTNVIYCTNSLTVSNVTNNAALGVVIKMIQVNTTWPWNGRVMTNSIVTYRAPDA